jgi:hypothetical protein
MALLLLTASGCCWFGLSGHRRMLDCTDSAVTLSKGTPWIVDDLMDHAPGGFADMALLCKKVRYMM